MKKILVCGAGGFIGTHLVSFLKKQGNFVIGVDIKNPKYSQTDADQFYNLDLRDAANVAKIVTPDIYEIYQLAADMGGAGYIFTGNNDADIMSNSVLINLNILKEMVRKNVTRVFFSSSACIYPSFNQTDPNNPLCSESSAYPANPDSEYGWEKLFSERLYLSYARNYNLHVRIARFHNIFGPLGSFNNGKEKAPAALCRKIALAKNNEIIDVWGPGTQTRSFLYIDECIKGIHKIMESNYKLPINLGSSRMISINDLAALIAKIANKKIQIKNISGPIGVMGRNSDNTVIQNELNWSPNEDLEYGLTQTYKWILSKV